MSKITIDDLAAWFALASSGKRILRSGSVRITDFDGAEVFLPEALDQVIEMSGGREYVINSPQAAQCAGAFDVSIISQAIAASSDVRFALQRWRRVKPADVRGQVRAVSKFIVEARAAFVLDNGSYESSDPALLSSFDGRNWSWASLRHSHLCGRPVDEQTRRNLEVAMAVSITREYDWLVDLGYEGYPAIRIPTDPTGVREVFALRDIPEGKKRRSALLHWVSSHYRKNRTDPTVTSTVREHLRGQQTFSWNGLRCRITPSPHDVRRLAEPKL